VNAEIEFFDCNARIGHPTVYREGQVTTKAELLAEMDHAGIDCALVYHSIAREWCPQEGNDALGRELGGEARLFPCFVGLPEATHELAGPDRFAEQVRELSGAVRLFPKEHNFSLSGWSTAGILGALQNRRVPVILDISQTSWDELSRLLGTYGDLPVILLDTYYRLDRYLYPLWETHDNLYLETTTYQVFRGIEAVCERFGPERLVFGTNLPDLETGGAVAQVLYAELDETAKAAIAGGTLKRLLGIDVA